MRMIVKLSAFIARVKPGIDPGAGLMPGIDRHRLCMVIWLVTLPVGYGDRCRGPRNLTAIPQLVVLPRLPAFFGEFNIVSSGLTGYYKLASELSPYVS
jgi:hypothetical protein